ncbi:uncharacterized protein Ecym_2411 [Eremothecium cymbalariae DBVPG|uniref:Uncharacterized protein n=1 Tax=Eremothecium cymbalariae (strain CBS 270.75 / DBVPG 7215 / KCTC 17166 / NRRL Y-17582) TaxID=931890 RepID=G8JP85_ERECY|nr:Hypothetical protein Ecym_2411 [Eremothecium cymbalariae DBVPG\
MATNLRTHLITVPCHSIWKQHYVTKGEENLGQLPEHWYLAPFQYEGNDHLAFIRHSLLAVRELINDIESSVLVFSGSETKEEAGPISEASSYYYMTRKLLKWIESCEEIPKSLIHQDKGIVHICEQIIFGLSTRHGIDIETLFTKYIYTECFALDSFENLLFSIGRFHEVTGSYPSTITIFGFEFKRERFLNLHAKAIDYPANKIKYIGEDPKPSHDNVQKQEYFYQLYRMEAKNALELFRKDWYGTRDALMTKKLHRNPFKRSQKYQLPLYHLNVKHHIIEDDKRYFENRIQGKMPWSAEMQ